MATTMTRQQILDFLRHNRQNLRQQYGVVRIGLFGSYAKDEQLPESDVDIAVTIESANTFRSLFGCKQFLEDGLQLRVDLGVEESLKPAIRERVSREMIYV